MSEPLEMNVDFEMKDTEMNMETDMNCNIKVPLPIASATQLGGIKVGENLSIAPDGTLSAEVSEDDIEQLQDNVSGLKEDYAQILDSAYVTDTASGEIASFPDGANGVPVKSLTVDVEPVQDLHGYDHPWPAGGGKNLCALNDFTTTKRGVTFTYVNGKLIINGTPQSTGWFGIGERLTLPAGTYTVSYKVSGDNPVVKIGFDNIGGYIQFDTAGTLQRTFTLSEEKTGAFDLFCNQTTAYANTEVLIQIEVGSSATSWTPYSNVCPITGRDSMTMTRTGKNLYGGTNSSYKNIIYGGKDNDRVAVTEDWSLKPGTYTLSFGFVDMTSHPSMFISYKIGEAWVITNKGETDSFTFTLPEGYTRLNLWAYSGTYSKLENIQIELGSTATAYEPCTAQTVEIPLGQTVYGGTLDVTHGVLTVDRAFIESYNGETLPSTWISDRDVYSAGTTPTTGAQVCYKLATSQTVQLTANDITTVLGQNNIWSDAGDVEVEYRADTKLYIEKLTAPTEDDMIADHAISANSFFMVGNTLYRATTAIASGATITVGTNATKLSLSDALNALA